MLDPNPSITVMPLVEVAIQLLTLYALLPTVAFMLYDGEELLLLEQPVNTAIPNRATADNVKSFFIKCMFFSKSNPVMLINKQWPHNFIFNMLMWILMVIKYMQESSQIKIKYKNA